MIDEKKLREKLDAVLEKSQYRSLWTFERKNLIEDVVQAVKECDKPKKKRARKTKKKEEMIVHDRI